MSSSPALVLVCLGGLGAAQFGGLWLAMRSLDRGVLRAVGRGRIDRILGRRRRRRIERWARVAPLGAVFSVGALAVGAIGFASRRW